MWMSTVKFFFFLFPLCLPHSYMMPVHSYKQLFFSSLSPFIDFTALFSSSRAEKKHSNDDIITHQVLIRSATHFNFIIAGVIALVMKYPQLVSSRAVREISDWLIKRLEDLDVEQPSVYSRLLLSLLHTPFKVNAIDILEIPQLKVKFN